MRFLMVLSDFIIPVTVLFIVVFGSLKRVNLYETFLEGAKEGFLGAITGAVKDSAAGIAVAIAFGYIVSLIFTPKSPLK